MLVVDFAKTLGLLKSWVTGEKKAEEQRPETVVPNL